MPKDAVQLHRKINDLIANWAGGAGVDPQHVDDYLLQLFRFQVAAIAAYAKFCAVQGADPASVGHWSEIPCAPAQLWKLVPMATAPAVAQPAAQFETSGTTDGLPGRAYLASVDTYDAAALATFRHFVAPPWAMDQPIQCLALVPNPALRPASSLGHMVNMLAGHLGPVTWLLDRHGSVDGPAFVQACESAVRLGLLGQGAPVMVFATTIALDAAIQQMPTDWRVTLPAGSRVIDTGGPKSRSGTLSRTDQHAWLGHALGVPAQHIIGELGMTECSSQRYETRLLGPDQIGDAPTVAYSAPPWLRSVVRRMGPDGDLSQVCQPDEIGLVAHFDGANIDTCAFIQTEDLGAVDTAGRLTLHGRLTGSELRGCGLQEL